MQNRVTKVSLPKVNCRLTSWQRKTCFRNRIPPCQSTPAQAGQSVFLFTLHLIGGRHCHFILNKPKSLPPPLANREKEIGIVVMDLPVHHTGLRPSETGISQLFQTTSFYESHPKSTAFFLNKPASGNTTSHPHLIRRTRPNQFAINRLTKLFVWRFTGSHRP